ncbi:UbiD family decarboxylase [Candidatus Micrarchaeota archaeon]|nr:UbiD family decarboxylase [Candidatus Micrarchaeota archaeon]
MVSFRDFVEKLKKETRVIELKKPVDKKLDMAGVFKTLENEKIPILGEDKDSGMKVVCNVYGDKKLVAEAIGCEQGELVKKLTKAIANPSEPTVIEKTEAPVLEKEEEVDLTKLPIPLHTDKDGGPYFSSAVIFVYDKELGRNASFHRMAVIDKDKLVIRMLPRNLNAFRDKAEERGENLKIAFAVGIPINALLAAATSVELGFDEMTIANSLSPIKMVEIENGIRVPAEAEYVYVGEITKEEHDEGPFVDLTETFDIIRKQRVIKINKIYHRKNSIHHVLLPGGLEHKVLMGMPREPTIWREVEKAGISVKGVNVTPGGCSWLHGVVSIDKKTDEDGKNAIEAAFQGHKSMKHVVIVDEDINIFDPNEVEWAIATRFQANRDVVMKEGAKGSSLDPSSDPETRATTKVGLDCTKPLVGKENFEKAEYKKVNVEEYR